MTFSGVLVIGNHPKLFKKNLKSRKKKSSDFSKIKILLCSSYARILTMLKFLKNSNFSPTKMIKQHFCILLPRATQKGPYFLKTIFSCLPWCMSHMLPEFSRKKFISLSKSDKKNQKIITKTSFFWLETLQFHLYCLSGI